MIQSSAVLARYLCKVTMLKKKNKNFTTFGQPTRLITCANHGNNVICSEVETVYDVVLNPQMILLCEKGAHGESVRCEQIHMLLPQRSQGSTLKNQTLVTTVASQTDPVFLTDNANCIMTGSLY